MVEQTDTQPAAPLRRSPRASDDPPPAGPAPVRRKQTKLSFTAVVTSEASSEAKAKDKPGNKRKRQNAGYAPPSKYAHLSLLPDAIGPNLLVQFVGLNPGVQTATSGHAYAHPSNLFWRLLHSSGITTRRCSPEEDAQMPELFSLGLTNIVSRPSRNGAELSNQEMDDGVAVLEEKARKWRPESMCFVGKSIWESVWRVRHDGKAVGKAFKYGWQDETENMGAIRGEWKGARVFVATTTSGLAASMSLAEKQMIWKQLGDWVTERRREMAADGEAATSKHFDNDS